MNIYVVDFVKEDTDISTSSLYSNWLKSPPEKRAILYTTNMSGLPFKDLVSLVPKDTPWGPNNSIETWIQKNIPSREDFIYYKDEFYTLNQFKAVKLLE